MGDDSGFFKKFVEFVVLPFDKSIVSVASEVGHLSPIIFTLGSAFIALITLNIPIAVLSLSSVEAIGVYSLFHAASTFAATPKSGVITEDPGDKCRSTFLTLEPSRFKYFMSQGLLKEFPNTPLYFISFAAAYCIQSMLFFNKETEAMGPQYSNRPYLAILGSAMFVVLYALYLLSYKCNSVLPLIGSVILGIVVGILICYQNNALFGLNAVDLLFLPPIVNRKGMDYICVSSQ